MCFPALGLGISPPPLVVICVYARRTRTRFYRSDERCTYTMHNPHTQARD
jgi:hypothetical protein